jgi:DNA-binding transcriptional ArsR family regulator
MSSIFPLRDNVTLDEDREPRLVELDEETADEVFTALSSGTTRKIFLELHKAPQTASDLADVTDTSVQNVQYHLEKLLDAELVEVVDTWYSERGSEMKVYAPQDESLVLFAGRDKQRSLRSLLRRLVGVLGVLVPGSALAGYATSRSGDGFGSLFGGGSSGDGDGGDGAYDATANGADDGSANGANGGDPNGMANGAPEEESEPETRSGDANNEDEMGADDGGGTENGEDAANGADGDAPAETPDTDVQVSAGEADNKTVDFNFATDGGQPDSAPDGAVDGVADGALDSVAAGAASAADGAAGLDPALAAAVAFFLGGLFVFVGLTMWYGTPDTWT